MSYCLKNPVISSSAFTPISEEEFHRLDRSVNNLWVILSIAEQLDLVIKIIWISKMTFSRWLRASWFLRHQVMSIWPKSETGCESEIAESPQFLSWLFGRYTSSS